ncbi:MAG: 4Fe-4S dicluster domain-containing protein [Pseudomonadota bacterium]
MSIHGFRMTLVWEGGPERPPGSLPELLFRDRCLMCGDCLNVCPHAVIVLGEDGFPEIDPLARGCSNCGLCAEICTPGAILPV